MKVVANREGLLSAFQIAAGVVPARSPKPILRNVKLELNSAGEGILHATDLEIGIRYKVSGMTVEKDGLAILPTSELMSILRELSDEHLILESTDGGVKVSGQSSQFELPSEDPTQFPDIPDFGDETGLKIKAGEFAKMIRRTVFSAATENTRYALNSILVEVSADGTVRMVATDGKRLAMMPGKLISGAGKAQEGRLLPPKAMQLVNKILLDPEAELEFVLRSNEALFRCGRVTMYTRLVEGRYPRYQDVFPPPAEIKIPLTVGPLHGVLRQAKIVTSEESRGCDCIFSSGLLTIASRAADVGQSEIRMPIGYDGEKMKITYDPQFLIDALRVLEPEEELSFELVDTKRATVIRTRDDYAYLVMPLTKG